ncbi:MAG: 16S rRNA (cytosine(1402)-N(4))-methyltransferase RsmH [Candidatus Omnitrophica bacterium]|nr:16S rRNA (cytosine(1402)-N(4))-methyltransferase RsmH [Candidatus Omnitrophota bacterium]
MSIHKPVMCAEVLQYLKPVSGDVVIDCTIGEGGHAQFLLEAIAPGGRLIGIDRDEDALLSAKENLKRFASPYTLIHDNFLNIRRIVTELGIKEVNGILFDLGVSSFQLDTPERGFSIRLDARLDMRMDQYDNVSAFDLVNKLPLFEIKRILKEYGEERWADRIANTIIKIRRKEPIGTTGQLRKIVLNAIPYKGRTGRIDPATRTFQAFRIAVNRELEALEEAVEESVHILKERGRICVISYHSLEDRIVKNQFKGFYQEGILTILTKKPVRAGDDEITRNPRARSAKLRAAEKMTGQRTIYSGGP